MRDGTERLRTALRALAIDEARMANQLTDEQIKTAIFNNLTVPVWPHAGRALGLSRNPAYQAARRGEIPVMRFGNRIVAPTASLRRMLGIEPAAGNATHNREST